MREPADHGDYLFNGKAPHPSGPFHYITPAHAQGLAAALQGKDIHRMHDPGIKSAPPVSASRQPPPRNPIPVASSPPPKQKFNTR